LKTKLPGGRLLRKSRLRKKRVKYVLGLVDEMFLMFSKRIGLVEICGRVGFARGAYE
jgi:hypothetical protein